MGGWATPVQNNGPSAAWMEHRECSISVLLHCSMELNRGQSLILGPPGGTDDLGKPALRIADYNGATPLSLASANGYVADGAENVMRRMT